MSDCGGDTGGDTGGCCDDTGGGGWCDDSAPCVDTSACEATTFSNDGHVYINQDTTYDGGLCYGDTTYSNSARRNNTEITGTCAACIFFIISVFLLLILCKLNIQYPYVWKFLHFNSLQVL